MDREFTQYRRNLPHFRLEDSTYFITWRTHPSFEPLPDFARETAFAAILHFNTARYDVLACVVMDDHVHVVLTPQPEWPLWKSVHSWKSYSAHEINKRLSRQGPVWLDESYDRIVRDEDELNEKLAYIYNNPLERWPDREDYPYLWIKGLTSERTGGTLHRRASARATGINPRPTTVPTPTPTTQPPRPSTLPTG
jgi:putative transposase